MISLVEALNFRCLRFARQPLSNFQVLVGPNASGKTTFLDVIAFLGRVVADGPEAAVRERTQDFRDLAWNRSCSMIELAVEARIPRKLRNGGANGSYGVVRYELAIGQAANGGEIAISSERVLLKPKPIDAPKQRDLFPLAHQPPNSLLSKKTPNGFKAIVSKSPNRNDNYYPEFRRGSGRGGWIPTFRLGPGRSALANLPEDETRFPIATWLKSLLSVGVQSIVLNSLLIRKASPPGQSRHFKPDGSNLPWIVHDLERDHPGRLAEWVAHVRTALPDIENVRTVERPDDRHRYLVIQYKGGLNVPSWVASDGTLRLLALTLPAYVPNFTGVHLIEEPENGIHPRAVETLVQALSSVYEAQVLMASHSTVVLSVVDPDKVLCFAKTENGATDIISGQDHPMLRDWRGEENLGVLFASGVLG